MRDYDQRWARNFNRAQRRLELKERAIAYLGGQCKLCKYSSCPAALVFHHVDPREKEFEISSRMSWEAIQKELNRCELLCSNCHAEVHAGWHPSLLLADDWD